MHLLSLSDALRFLFFRTESVQQDVPGVMSQSQIGEEPFVKRDGRKNRNVPGRVLGDASKDARVVYLHHRMPRVQVGSGLPRSFPLGAHSSGQVLIFRFWLAFGDAEWFETR
jgi:hypothetical protein